MTKAVMPITGGMTEPRADETDSTAAACSELYPALVMSGMVKGAVTTELAPCPISIPTIEELISAV